MNDYRGLLRRVFEAIPEAQRLDFLLETARSLGEGQKAALRQALTQDEAPTAPNGAGTYDVLANLNASPVEGAVARIAKAAPSSPGAGDGEAPDMERLIAQFQAENQQNERAVRREVWGCLAWALVAAAAIVGLGVGGRTLFDYLMSLF